MKFNVHAGHCPDGKGAYGAVGLIKESTEARKVKDLVIKYLRQLDHTVYDCTCEKDRTKNECLKDIVSMCNSHKVDLDISIHFNAGAKDKKGDGTTTGTEVFVYSSKSKAKDEATRVCEEMKKLGFKNRGVKCNDGLYVLKHTDAPAMLIEVCFVDDKDDVELYKANVDKVARAIVKGLTGKEVPIKEEKKKELLTVDGLWGKATTRRAQEVFGTKVDGFISNQKRAYKDENKGLLPSTFEWLSNPSNGSSLIKAIQKYLNGQKVAELSVDGFLGPKTIKAMQKWLGTAQDGKVSKPSAMVRAFQRWLNKQ